MKLQYNDAQHSYWLDGKRMKSVTTVAKIPEDTYRLEQWSQRQVAIGLAVKPALLERVSANVDNNQAVNAICEEAAREAGAHEGRDRGNVLHTALEAHDLGKRFIPTDLTNAAIVGWENICEAMGWTVELVERCVVWPGEMIAGRFDRIVKDRKGRRYVTDFKGGAKVVNYPHAIACQLALYANAPLLAGPISGEGGFTEQFEPLENVDRALAYVVHLPPDGDAQLIEINIGAALPVIKQVIFPTINWRAAKGLAKIVELPTVEGGGDSSGAKSPMASTPSHPEPSPFDAPPTELINPEVVDGQLRGDSPFPHPEPSPFDAPAALIQAPQLGEWQSNLAKRLTWLKENHRAQAQIIASRWPQGCPAINKGFFDADSLDEIERLVIEAERAVEAPFDPQVSTPGVQPEPPFVSHLDPPASGSIEEGPDMEPADIAAFKSTFEALEKDQQQRIDQWAAQAHDAGAPISMRSKPSKRRFSIGRFCLYAADQHEDVVRAVLGLALGDEIQTSVTTGSVLGALTQPEVETAWQILLSIGHTYQVVRDPTVRLVVAA